MQQKQQDSLLTAREVSRILNCSPSLVYKMASRRQLPAIRWSCQQTDGKRPKKLLRFDAETIMTFKFNNSLENKNE
jgi:hypothetical protein